MTNLFFIWNTLINSIYYKPITSFSKSAASIFVSIWFSPTNINASPLFKDFISIFSFSDKFAKSAKIFIFSSSSEKNVFMLELFNILFPYIPFSKLNRSDISCVIATALPPYFLIVLKILYIKLATFWFDVTPISLQISSKYFFFPYLSTSISIFVYRMYISN